MVMVKRKRSGIVTSGQWRWNYHPLLKLKRWALEFMCPPSGGMRRRDIGVRLRLMHHEMQRKREWDSIFVYKWVIGYVVVDNNS